MTILLFLLVLFVLILVHEWGHFIVAKKTGMRVDEFGIGFPPRLLSIKKNGTEYTLNALPIGGFVKIFGENAEDAADAAGNGENISGSFTSKSKWAQAAVLIAGVTMNILFAWVLFIAVFLVGVPTAIDETKATSAASLVVTSILPGSPADEAGLPVGAHIVSYSDGGENAVLTPTAFRTQSANETITPMTITYTAGSVEKTVEVLPKTGLIDADSNQPAIGVTLSLVETVKKPFVSAVVEATRTTYNSLIAIAGGLGSLFVDIAQRDADLSQVAGPIGIVGLVGEAAEFGITSLLMFTAFISLNLAVINMLPLPALDGGRLVMVGIEAILRRPLNPVWVARVNMLGFALLLLLMIAVSYSDIAKLIT